jgi:hypothetical protein
MSVIIWLTTAYAAEVVWLTPPTPEDQAIVAAAAGARDAPLSTLKLRSAASAASADDDQAFADLAEVLSDVRAFETKLDGELLILRDLETPLRALTVLRNAVDRDAMFNALVYQGFAANRFWGEALGTDPEAAAWRVEMRGLAVERPWRDAAALNPDAEVTAYQIAEAPQRIAYDGVRTTVGGALPASLAVSGLADDVALVIDGSERAPGPSGNVKVPPGRHFVHVEHDGVILDRWTVVADSGEQIRIDAEADGRLWRDWLDGLTADADIPAPVSAAIEALGGEVWIAAGTGRDLKVFQVTPEAITPKDVDALVRGEPAESGISGWGTLGVGWLSSGNFYTDNAVDAPHSRATVNALSPSLAIGGDLDIGWFRAALGAELILPIGAHHTVPTVDGASRVRPQLQASVGIRPVQLIAGYMFPHHPVVGAQAGWTVGPLELRGSYSVGLPGTPARSDGSTWDRLETHRAGIAVGARIK